MRDFVAKIRKAFGGDKAKMDEAAKEAFGSSVAELQEIETLWRNAAKASAERV